MDDTVLKQAASSKQSPQQICEAASLAIAKADKGNLHFLAPQHLAQVSGNLQEGQENIKAKETQTQGMAQYLKVNKLVENGIAIKSKIKIALNDSLTELDMLKKVDEATLNGPPPLNLFDELKLTLKVSGVLIMLRRRLRSGGRLHYNLVTQNAAKHRFAERSPEI